MANNLIAPVGQELAAFWNNVYMGPETECWIWTAARTKHGYGRCSAGGQELYSHRVAWFMQHGDPVDLDVLHKCDNPSCVNPIHLFLGTHADNMADRAQKKRTYRSDGTPISNYRLKPQQVHEIRRLYSQGGIGALELARQFGVFFTSITAIICGRSWRNLPWESEGIRQAALASAKSRHRSGRNLKAA